MTTTSGTRPALEILTSRERSAAARAWTALESSLDDPPLASSWLWTETWLGAYGDVVPHSFALLLDGGRPVGAALLCEEMWRRGPLRLRRVHVGTAGEPAGESVYVE